MLQVPRKQKTLLATLRLSVGERDVVGRDRGFLEEELWNRPLADERCEMEMSHNGCMWRKQVSKSTKMSLGNGGQSRVASAEDVHLGEGSISETEGHEVVGPHEGGPEKATLRVGVFFYIR